MKFLGVTFPLLGFLLLAGRCASAGADTLVGELPGKFEVNNLGAASYTIPLDVVPGVAGVEPKLALSYSSRGHNGLLGVGFFISGLSAITRAGASLDQDGFIDGIDFDDTDRFLLDGQRLDMVALNGTPTTNRAFYGDAESEYRTEIDSFSRVCAYGQAGNGPAWFKVWTQSGLICEYGNSADSSFRPGTNRTVLSWAVNKISDTVGNDMTFSYHQTAAGLQISRIDYTGNMNATLVPSSSVEFIYEARPDPELTFLNAIRMERTNRLSKILMKHDQRYVHEYRLVYGLSATGQSLLTSIQQFFGEGAGTDRLPETRFEYNGYFSASNLTYRSGVSFIPNGETGSVYRRYAEGYADTTETMPLVVKTTHFVPGDYNGDGLTDIAAFYPNNEADTCWIGLSKGDGTFAFTSGTNFIPKGSQNHVYRHQFSADGTTFLSADFNGDGIADLVGLSPHNESSQSWIGLAKGDGSFIYTSGTNFIPNGGLGNI